MLSSMTIQENLAFSQRRGLARRFKYCSSKPTASHFIESLKPLGMKLEDRLEEEVQNLSGGQRQALSLVMTTMAPSKILLLDEHTAALDPKVAAQIMEITERLVQEKGLATLMVTHNMAHALKYGTRTLVMHEGKIIQELSLAEKKSLKPADLMTLFEKY
jgi:putative ABC transport system ATP-binding protein